MNVSALLLALAAAASTGAPSNESKDVPIPEKVPSPVSSEVAPTVNIRTLDNGDVVEEYRLGGQLTMVRVTPAHGKPYYLYADNKGRLDRSDAERNGGVSPVYWVIYEWK
jgi:hypothetical protein